MDTNIIPFPRGISSPPSVVPAQVSAFCKMLREDIKSEARKPERFFVCYEEDGKTYYLNLGFHAFELKYAIAKVVKKIKDGEEPTAI
jgi:hypothetical protein